MAWYRLGKLAQATESNDPIVTLVNGRELDVFLELPEELGGSIAPGLPVTLATRSLPSGSLPYWGGSFC